MLEGSLENRKKEGVNHRKNVKQENDCTRWQYIKVCAVVIFVVHAWILYWLCRGEALSRDG